MKSYNEILSEIYKTLLNNIETGNNKLSDDLDNIIIWIIGISTGSIALIFASTGNINFISRETLNLTLLFLILSIIFGVVGRGLSAISSFYGYHLNSAFSFALRKWDIPFNHRILKGDETAETIYLFIKEDFDLDYSIILEGLKTQEANEIEEYNMKIRKFYDDFIEAKRKDFSIAVKAINEIMIDSFGFKKNHFEKSRKNNRIRGIIMRLSTILCLILYAFSMLTFLIAISYISIKYYCEIR